MKRTKSILNTSMLWMVLAIIPLSISCSKEELWIDAVVLDFGSPSVDGCGFVLQVEDQFYYPINLEEKYHIDGKNIQVQYRSLNEMHTCGFSHSGNQLQKINIRKIENK